MRLTEKDFRLMYIYIIRTHPHVYTLFFGKSFLNKLPKNFFGKAHSFYYYYKRLHYETEVIIKYFEDLKAILT